MTGDLWLYLTIVVVMAITPGPDIALIVRAATAAGMRGALRVMAGIVAGLLVHAACSIVGVSAVIAASPTALDALRIAGAAWLGWIGIGALRAAFARVDAGASATDERPPGFRLGFVTNLLNAKILLFYLAFLPQFAPAGDRFAVVAAPLALVQIAVGLTVLISCAALASRLRVVLQPGMRPRRIVDGVSGAIILAASIELLWSALH